MDARGRLIAVPRQPRSWPARQPYSAAAPAPFFPVAVWYSGGTARAPAKAEPATARAVSAAASWARARDPAPAASALPPSVSTRSTGGAADAFVYFVQAGAYARMEDADQQRARLAMLGLDARITEREQAGRTAFRVRLGPFDRRDDAEAAQARLSEAKVESNLVRVER